MIFLKKSQKSTAMQHWQLQQGFPGKKVCTKNCLKVKSRYKKYIKLYTFKSHIERKLAETISQFPSRKISLIVCIVCQKFQNRHRVLKSAVFWRKNSLKVTIIVLMLKWRPFRSTLTFARKLVLALASVQCHVCCMSWVACNATKKFNFSQF